MTWNINIQGHDDLSGDEKIAYENAVIEKAKKLAADLRSDPGGIVTTAVAATNTTGSVDLLA